MNQNITYEDLKLANYVNSTAVGNIAGQELILQDITAAGLLAKLNFICKGQKSSGKTQLMRDIYDSYFNGEEHSLWEAGRSDFRPRDLFERLNISLAKGQSARIPEIKTSYDKQTGQLKFFAKQYSTLPGQSESLAEITEKEAEDIAKKYATTSDSIIELMNTDKNFFCIDEYNRCPEVVMNLFYSLMTGEINHQGKVVQLGGGYYSGMAAVNPEDYSGTFKMDAAMWARFHIALDFDAYRISAKDKDELITRNLSPDVHPSGKKDLLPQIIKLYESIKAAKPTLEERMILQYFQTGLDCCTKHSQSKETICWPKPCFTEGCKKATNTCGLLKGLDQRAIRAVYRLAKGLEAVTRIKSGDENLDIDPLDSLMLAYEFVAPYKGCVNPKMTKERNGIEALVIKDHADPIKKELGDKLNKFREMLEKDRPKKTATSDIGKLKEQLKKMNSSDICDKIEQELTSKYTVEKSMTLEELMKQQPEAMETMTKASLKGEIESNMPSYENAVLEHLKSESEENFKKLAGLKRGLTKGEYKELKAKKGLSKDFDTLTADLRKAYESTIKRYASSVTDKLTAKEAAETFKVEKKAMDDILDKITKDVQKNKITYMPKENEPTFKKELTKKLQEAVNARTSIVSQEEKDKLFSEEFEFLGMYYDEAAVAESER